MRILFIGERINNRTLTNARVALWHRYWLRLGWRAAFLLPVSGHSLNRLKKLVPFGVGRTVINILPPDNKCGTWDKELAKKMQDTAASELNGNSYDCIILLGRRVIDLFFPKVKFGTRAYYNGLPVLCMPHPSGRNRYWSDKNAEQRVRRWIKKLLEMVEK